MSPHVPDPRPQSPSPRRPDSRRSPPWHRVPLALAVVLAMVAPGCDHTNRVADGCRPGGPCTCETGRPGTSSCDPATGSPGCVCLSALEDSWTGAPDGPDGAGAGADAGSADVASSDAQADLPGPLLPDPPSGLSSDAAGKDLAGVEGTAPADPGPGSQSDPAADAPLPGPAMVPAEDLSGRFPEVVLVLRGDSYCAGTLVGPRTVVTAAHCLCTCPADAAECLLERHCDPAGGARVLAFADGGLGGPAFSLAVPAAGIHVHPGFHLRVRRDPQGRFRPVADDPATNDVAVLVADECVPAGTRVATVATGGLPVQGTTVGTLAGFGRFECGTAGDAGRRWGCVRATAGGIAAGEAVVDGPGDSGGPLLAGCGTAANPAVLLGVVGLPAADCPQVPAVPVASADEVRQALALVDAPPCCTPGHHQACAGGDLYRFDSCGRTEGLVQACNDGNPCTTDTCPVAACGHAPVADGTACGAGKVCQDGTCACRPKDHRGCHGGDVYWYDSCGTRGGLERTCGSGDPCLADACEEGACRNDPVPDGTSCGGGVTCHAGACACRPYDHLACDGDRVRFFDSCGMPGEVWESCDDGDPCTVDGCALGECQHVLDCAGCCTGRLEGVWATVVPDALGDDEVEVRYAVRNPTRCTHPYRAALYDETGRLVDQEPDASWLPIGPGAASLGGYVTTNTKVQGCHDLDDRFRLRLYCEPDGGAPVDEVAGTVTCP